MRTSITVLLTLLLAATAQAHTKRLTVDDTARWSTPQTYGPNAAVMIRTYVNGSGDPIASYSGKRGFVTRKNGVAIEVYQPKGRGHIRFRIANFRDRDAHVKITYSRG